METSSAAQAGSIAAVHSSIYTYEKDLSLNPNLDLAKMRFMRTDPFPREGRPQGNSDIWKLFVKGYQSTSPTRIGQVPC